MKAKIAALLLFIFMASLQCKGQQILNGNFDTWSGNDPIGWYDINQYLATLGYGGETLVSEDTTPANVAPGCIASAKLQTDSVQSLTLPAILSLGSFTFDPYSGALTVNGIPYSYRPDSITLQYKYEIVSPDSAQFGFSLTQWNYITNVENLIGGFPPGTTGYLTDTGSSFHTLTINPDYQNAGTPDSLWLFFISGASKPTIGNTLWLDTISMIFNDTATDVKNLNIQTVVSLYPVPATTTLRVTVSEAMLHNAYAIFGINGQLVWGGIIESLTSVYQISQLASGTYTYSILDANKSPVNQAKFIVAK